MPRGTGSGSAASSVPGRTEAISSGSGMSCENPTARPRRAPAAITTRRPGRRRYTKALRERLDEADFRSEDPRRHRAVDADDRATLRIEDVVARVAQDAAKDLRQLDLREEAIDQQLIFGRDLLVEELGVIEGVASRDGKVAEAPRVVRGDAAAVEAEARSAALLDEGGDLPVTGACRTPAARGT